jgi:hypothetical protein
MRKISLSILSFLLVFGSITVNAQQKIVINEVLEYMSQGEKTGIEIAIVDALPADVEDSFVKFMKKYKGKPVTSKKTVEIFIDNALIPQMSANTVDVYAIARKADYGTKLSVFVDLGGAFVSSQEHDIAFGSLEALGREFALSEAVRIVEAELKAQEKVMKDLSKELENMIKDKDSYIKEIEKAKALIAQREMDIINNEKAQETKRQQISIQEEIVKTVKQKRAQIDY